VVLYDGEICKGRDQPAALSASGVGGVGVSEGDVLEIRLGVGFETRVVLPCLREYVYGLMTLLAGSALAEPRPVKGWRWSARGCSSLERASSCMLPPRLFQRLDPVKSPLVMERLAVPVEPAEHLVLHLWLPELQSGVVLAI
jgi:hypothetical protein